MNIVYKIVKAGEPQDIPQAAQVLAHQLQGDGFHIAYIADEQQK